MRRGRTFGLLVGLALIALGVTTGSWAPSRADEPRGQDGQPGPPPARYHEVELRPGRAAPRVDTGRRDRAGRPVVVMCGTCHATKAPDSTTRATADLVDFHQGLQLAHGGQSCLSCHDARDYDRLKLADGSPLAFEQVVTLCSQCHGPQRRDFDHGAHGGMMGHWDLQAGGRVRHACTTCHDPHAPAYPAAMPVFAPRDAYEVRGRAHD